MPYYLDALSHLQELKGDGKIKHVGLTNFDTKHLQVVMDKGIQIASNQVPLVCMGVCVCVFLFFPFFMACVCVFVILFFCGSC